MTASTPLDLEDLRPALAAAVGPALGPVEIVDLHRLKGGYSRQMWSFDAVLADGTTRPLVLCANSDSGVVGDDGQSLDRVTEARLLRALHATGLPVPDAICAADRGSSLRRPYFVMERIAGTAAIGPFHRDPWYLEHREEIGSQFAALLAAVHGADVPEGLLGPPPEAATVGAREAARWRSELEATPEARTPTVDRALAWLETHGPRPPARVTLVHGDYRTGNIIHGHDDLGADGLRAILDWEMAHLGDPLEDVGYAQLSCWRVGTDRVGGLVPLDLWPAVYGVAAGVEVDPPTLRWWEVLASVKMACLTWRAAGTTEPGAERDLLLRLCGEIGQELDGRLLVD
jgi:aminoglycoside phosphotransferase (APT) family kinase protein